jgi:hypothetical protein
VPPPAGPRDPPIRPKEAGVGPPRAWANGFPSPGEPDSRFPEGVSTNRSLDRQAEVGDHAGQPQGVQDEGVNY